MLSAIRKTPRANWHEYDGATYFITICTDNRVHYFGEVHNGQMQLTLIGEYLKTQIESVQSHYAYAEIPMYVIMPNHVHLIVVIDGDKTPYDRKIRDKCRDVACRVHEAQNAISDADTAHNIPTTKIADSAADAARDVPTTKNAYMQNIAYRQGWLSVCIGGIKSAVTRFANQNNIAFKWQSRYHDHIIRNSDEINLIANYIEQNPQKWEEDCYYGNN